MKKILCAVTLLAVLLCGCRPLEKDLNFAKPVEQDYISGVWISYSELDAMLTNEDFKKEFQKVVSNCNSQGLTDIFVHVRPFCDSIYPSELFPLRHTAASYNFDVLEYMIDRCHQLGIRIHAWINPYRVRTADSNIESLPDDSLAYKWLKDDDITNDKDVILFNGIYLNPASYNAQQLVVDGIREILNNYDVDGIHFDDYFYPTTDSAFDQADYRQYIENCETPLSLDDWRRANVNALISGCYTAVKFINKNAVFSISPAASIMDNYSKLYADVALWCESDCVDYIIPQLYFGFDYPDEKFRFDSLLQDWKKVCGATKLAIGLATYKINTDSEPDRQEWASGNEIISRQIEICRSDDAVFGHILFSYSSAAKYFESVK